MSELLEESQRDEADLLLDYHRQIAGLKAELGEQDERHRREIGDRSAEVEAARSLVGKNEFTEQMTQMIARAEKAAALKDLESMAREVLQVRLQLSEANQRLKDSGISTRSFKALQNTSDREGGTTNNGQTGGERTNKLTGKQGSTGRADLVRSDSEPMLCLKRKGEEGQQTNEALSEGGYPNAPSPYATERRERRRRQNLDLEHSACSCS